MDIITGDGDGVHACLSVNLDEILQRILARWQRFGVNSCYHLPADLLVKSKIERIYIPSDFTMIGKNND